MSGWDAYEELTVEQRAALDRMTPEDRHAAMEWWHAQRAAVQALQEGFEKAARKADEAIDEFLVGASPRERAHFLDCLVDMGLLAQRMREFAAGRGPDAED